MGYDLMELLYINGHHIHFRFLDNRSARSILFINPLGSDFRIWDELIPLIQDQANIILYDKRGHGLSDFIAPSNRLEDYAEDANGLLEKLSIRRAIIVGLSVGGQIAAMLASKNPGLADRLVLCDTAAKIGNDISWNQRIETVKRQGLATISGDIMKRWFSTSFHQKFPGKVAGYKNMLERCQPAAYIRACESIRDTDLAHMMRQLRLPALCIVGEGDLSTTPADVQYMSTLIPDASFRVIDGSGHVPCVDNPEKFSRLILDFIN